MKSCIASKKCSYGCKIKAECSNKFINDEDECPMGLDEKEIKELAFDMWYPPEEEEWY